ncbi:hypothetical protein DP939_09435 [Spongiactinospora rosea]|uniref:Histidine kinase/HSP90-like ATPase domain-containing protein n=1 Tax=Spongiactinospora rosea TaxID=2248750 RepID=A0A366M3N4_9ACTN|nr:hypothetical protein DP939_09435 [Spongiactinospora rosea]
MKMAAHKMRLVGEMRFPGRTDIISDVRIYTARWLTIEHPESAEDDDLIYNLRLLTTEIAANAIKHTISGRWKRGAFKIRMWLGARSVRVEVFDQGSWSRPRLRDDPTETGGRGLRIVAATAMRWGVARRGFGRVVWFELPVGPVGPQAAIVTIPRQRARPGSAGQVGDQLGEDQFLLHPDAARGHRRGQVRIPWRRGGAAGQPGR